MDSIDFNGKKYIPSKQAAKISGYAQDYVGQLAREEKVPGTRIGRSWYIDEEAILLHAGVSPQNQAELQEVTGLSLTTQDTSQKTRHQGGDITVERQINKKPLHSLQKNNTHSFKTWNAIQYLEDSSDLLPLQKKLEESQSIQIKRITNENIDNPSKIKSVSPKIRSSEVSSRKEPVADIHQSNRTLQKIPFGLIGTASFVLLLLVSALSGINTSDSWVYEGSQQVASLSNSIESDPFKDLFLSVRVFFFEGVRLLVFSVSFFISSADSFFQLGLEFFKGFFR